MPLLSGLFGDSESGNSNDFLGVVDGALGIDFSNVNYSQEIDDDGSSETSYNATSFGTDVDLGSILSSMSDSFSENDSGGGLFG
jgi:hypothetical protein